jgi:membrane associated rhomboid family serine protease
VFPLSDDSPRRAATPTVTWLVIGACLLVFLWQSSLGAKAGEIALYQYGMIPARLFGLAHLRSHVAIPASATVLTSMFLHGGWLHLGLNMLFLWVFGGKVEDSMGHSRFLIFYLLCGGRRGRGTGDDESWIDATYGWGKRGYFWRAWRLFPSASAG